MERLNNAIEWGFFCEAGHRSEHKVERAQTPRGHKNETVDRGEPFRLERHVPVDRGKRDRKNQRDHSAAAQHAHLLRIASFSRAVLQERPAIQEVRQRDPYSEINNCTPGVERNIQITGLEFHCRMQLDLLRMSPLVERMRTENDRNK